MPNIQTFVYCVLWNMRFFSKKFDYILCKSLNKMNKQLLPYQFQLRNINVIAN